MREIIDATLRRQRLTAAILLAVCLPAGAVAGRAAGTTLGALVGLLPVVLLSLGLVQLSRRRSDAGLRLDPREGSFYAPPSRRTRYTTVFFGFVAYQTSYQWQFSSGSWWLGLLAAALTAAVAVFLWWRVPGVSIDPTGITTGWPRPALFVPWSALDPLGPPPASKHDGILRLPLARPGEVTRRGIRRHRREERVRLQDVDVSPVLLTAAIGHYARHPEHRAAIGTPEEYDRLRRALGGTP